MISVIIVNYNVKDYLANCITSIKNSHVNQSVEIIIVDNDSFDGSVNFLRDQFPDITIIENSKNVGFAKAVNIGLQAAKGEYALILNPDTIVQENSLQIFSNYLNDNPKVGICGPKILNADGTLQLSCKRSFPTPGVALPKLLGLSYLFPNNRWTGKYNLTYLDEDKIHSVDAISGSCMFVRCEVFNEIGYLDEQYFMFGEDLDFCFRIKEAGYEVHYLPTTQIVHYKGESVKVAQFDSIRAFYNAMDMFVEKHFSKTTSIVTKSGLKIGIFLKRIVAISSSFVSQIIPAFLDTVIVLSAFIIAIPIRFGNFDPLFESYIPVLSIYVIVWLSAGSLFQLYSRYKLSYNRAVLSSVISFLGIVAFTYFFKQFAFSRAVILIAALIIGLTVPGWRLLAHILISRGYLKRFRQKQFSLFSRRAVIIGADSEGVRIARSIVRRLDTGIEIVGFCDKSFEGKHVANLDSEAPILGLVSDIRSIVKIHSIRELIFTSGKLTNEDIVSIMDETKDLRLTYRIVPKEKDLLLGKAIVEDVSDFQFVNIEYTLYRKINIISKRLFDLVISSLILLTFSPVLLIMLISNSKWERIQFWGIDRSMFFGWIAPSKSRFLKELPLLIAVFQGDMSFVGSSLTPVKTEAVNLLCKPGLTGLDRIKKTRNNSDERLVYDHYYVQNQSLLFDVEILIRTIFVL